MNSLRRYIDILAEADAPATPTNPWTNDPVKAAAWEKLSPQMKSKIGGADPTDKIIISAMADGSGWGRAKGINDANPDGTPKASLSPQQQAQNILQPGTNNTASQSPNDPASNTNALGVASQANIAGSPAQAIPVPDPAPVTVKPDAVAPSKATVTPNSKEQIAIIQQMQKELGVKPDGKIGPNTDTAMKAKPEIAAKYADQIAGATRYAAKPAATPANPGNISGKPSAAAPTADNAATTEIPAKVQAIQKPSIGQEVWFNGTRYKYQGQGGSYNPDGTYSHKYAWSPTFKKGDWGWNDNQAKSRQGYTSPELAASQPSGVAAKPAVKEGRIAKNLIESFGYKAD